MYRTKDRRQLELENFHLPFGGHLNPRNRWIQLTKLIPWKEFEATYACHFSKEEKGVQSLLHGPPVLPSDFPMLQSAGTDVTSDSRNAVTKAREAIKEVIKSFGELLLLWPDIWQAAKELRENGIEMTRKL